VPRSHSSAAHDGLPGDCSVLFCELAKCRHAPLPHAKQLDTW
jgi:hypothetical protein